MNNYQVFRFPNSAFYSAVFVVLFVVLLLTEIIFYQFYYYVPITVNGKKIVVKKAETIQALLTRKNLMPKYGQLMDVEGKVIPQVKGGAPIIEINNKTGSLNDTIQSPIDIRTKTGLDKIEKFSEKVEESQSKITYKGQGAFIYVIKKGRPGVRSIKRGFVSGKTVYSKWLVTPQDFTVGKLNIRFRKVIALTFDDGPSKYTSLILKILKENKAKASFFVLGEMIKKRPVWLKEMFKRHYTIGNHTFSHVSLLNSPTPVIIKELEDTEREIFKATGAKSKFLRPPEGALNSSAINFLLKQGYRISLWNVDTEDWKIKSSQEIESTVLNHLKPGQVVLLHDGGGNRMNTARALPGIIKGIKKAGYRLVTLDDLYNLIE